MRKQKDDDEIAKLFKAIVEEEGLSPERAERAVQRFMQAIALEADSPISQSWRKRHGREGEGGKRGR